MHSRSSKPNLRPTLAAGLAAIVCALALLSSCAEPQAIPALDPSVIFSYPVDGQVDVPIGSKITIGFSEPIQSDALSENCSEESGGLCVIGPNGPVVGQAVVSDGGTTVQFSGELRPATRYDVWVQPSLLSSSPQPMTAGPLFSFATRSERPRQDAAPFLVSINGETPDTLGEGRLPLVDFATLRILFSEPMSTATFEYGESVGLYDSAGRLVEAVIATDRLHLSIDPVSDLEPGTTHRIQFASTITDTSGQPLADFERSFVPLDSRGDNGLAQQTLSVSPAGLSPSPHLDVPTNAIEVEKPIVGRQSLSFVPTSISAELGDASQFGGPIPITVRRGQELLSSGLEIDFGGEVPSNVDFGNTNIRFITDATGFLFRNPYRRADRLPDDQSSPLHIQLDFDVALFSTEPQGNSIVSQNILHVQTSGTAVVRDGTLLIELVGGLEVDILGISTGNGNLGLLLQTERKGALAPADTTPPQLVSSYPFAGQRAFDASDRLMFVFDEPVSDLAAGVDLVSADGAAVPMRFDSQGATLLATPLTPLEDGSDFELRWTGVSDLAGNVGSSAEPIRFSTVPRLATNVPVALTALRPGAPCAVAAGRCVGGSASDDSYDAFTIGPEEPVEGYFTQAVQPASLTLASQCNAGSIRVEEIDPSGDCLGVVQGALTAFEHRFRFVPNEPWEVGRSYRLTMVGGGNGSCDAGEVCGRNGMPLNTDILSGNLSAGGPPIEIPFEVNRADYPGAYIPIELAPATDTNGSGFVALEEIPRPENRVVFEIASTSGIVSAARFTDTDCIPDSPQVEGCIYLSGTVPILLEEPRTNCTIATGANGPIIAETCVPLILTSQVFFGTSASVEADVLLLTPDVTLGRVALRILGSQGAPARAFIYESNGQTRLGGDIEVYVDAPSLDISIPGSGHDLRSRRLTLPLDGPVTFFDDGRVRINMSNTIPIDLSVAVDFLGIGIGGIDLQIPPNGLTLQLASPLIRSGDPGALPFPR